MSLTSLLFLYSLSPSGVVTHMTIRAGTLALVVFWLLLRNTNFCDTGNSKAHNHPAGVTCLAKYNHLTWSEKVQLWSVVKALELVDVDVTLGPDDEAINLDPELPVMPTFEPADADEEEIDTTSEGEGHEDFEEESA
mmetsp:Transcript_4850/g.14921  ORF Transcript_4850/g.14921 Transcript_4850/m.14921 type:complete len:137 (-) Transcript_4850:104-514(-)